MGCVSEPILSKTSGAHHNEKCWPLGRSRRDLSIDASLGGYTHSPRCPGNQLGTFPRGCVITRVIRYVLLHAGCPLHTITAEARVLEASVFYFLPGVCVPIIVTCSYLCEGSSHAYVITTVVGNYIVPDHSPRAPA